MAARSRKDSVWGAMPGDTIWGYRTDSTWDVTDTNWGGAHPVPSGRGVDCGWNADNRSEA